MPVFPETTFRSPADVPPIRFRKDRPLTSIPVSVFGSRPRPSAVMPT